MNLCFGDTIQSQYPDNYLYCQILVTLIFRVFHNKEPHSKIKKVKFILYLKRNN